MMILLMNMQTRTLARRRAARRRSAASVPAVQVEGFIGAATFRLTDKEIAEIERRVSQPVART
jgi:hypothetical protein